MCHERSSVVHAMCLFILCQKKSVHGTLITTVRTWAA